jgi:flagellar protein FlaF
MSLQTYQAVQATIETPRETEYRLFAQVTRMLMDQSNSTGSEFFRAVDKNRRVWLTMQMDLVSEDNRLPDELKAGLISLAIWVDKHSAAVMRGQKDIQPLIDVNRSIMEGLAGQVEEEPRLAS